MKRHSWILSLCAVIAIALTSCVKDVEIGSRSQLIGRWQSGQAYIVFEDNSAGEGYAWGKEWDESEGVMESDVDADYHGNNWFKWKKGSNYIRVANTMNISTGESALDWTLYALTDTEMKLQQGNKTRTYQKISY